MDGTILAVTAVEENYVNWKNVNCSENQGRIWSFTASNERTIFEQSEFDPKKLKSAWNLDALWAGQDP